MEQAEARSVFAYCNGKNISIFSGTVEGVIVTPRGNNSFGWDCVFQPENCSLTLAEFKDAKNRYSMRKKVLEQVKIHLKEEITGQAAERAWRRLKTTPSYICISEQNLVQAAVFDRRGILTIKGASLNKSENPEKLLAQLI